MRYPAYPEYKDSGVQWLGKVPGHWEVKRLKMAAHLNDKKIEADEDNPVPYIGMENIESWTGKLLPIDPDVVPTGVANRFTAKNTLFGKLRPYLAKACNLGFDGLCSTELLVIESKDFDQRALPYWLLTDGFIKLIDSSTYGSKMPRANWNFIGNCLLPVPPLPEQTAIADFLDRETKRIDTLVTKKRRLIALLKEKRTALISRTVTRGLPESAAREFSLEPHTRFKDSGIEWLGEIPERWEVKKVRHVSRFKGGSTPPTGESQYWDDGEFPWVSPKDMKTGRLLDTQDHLTRDGVAQCASGIIEPGHLLIVVRSGILRHSLPAAINDVHVTLNQDMRAFILKKQVQSEFLRWLIEGNQKTLLEIWCKSGTTVESIEMTYLSESSIPVPPIVEQMAIATYLNHETTKIDRLVGKAEAAIERLQEYRTALITAAVTGKIDVRDCRHSREDGSPEEAVSVLP